MSRNATANYGSESSGGWDREATASARIQTPVRRGNRGDFKFTYESAEKFCQENVPTAVPSLTGPTSSLCQTSISFGLERPLYASGVTVSALEAGKHVFCQARMANDPPNEEMLTASRRFPASDHVCPAALRLRGDRVVKKLLAENFLGQLHTIRLQSL